MFTVPEIVLAIVVSAFGAAMQGTIGFGFGVLSVPILTLVDSNLTPIPQLMLALPLAIGIALRERRHLDLAGAGWIVAGRVPGALIGGWLIAVLNRRALDGLIAFIVLAATAAIASGASIRRTRLAEFGAGVASGVSGTTSAVGGPPVALLYADRPGATVRSTLSGIFIVGLTINLTALAVIGEIRFVHAETALILAPGVVVGFLASSRISNRVRGHLFRRAVLVASMLSALGLAVKVVVAG